VWTGVGGGPEKVSAGWHGMSNVICVFLLILDSSIRYPYNINPVTALE